MKSQRQMIKRNHKTILVVLSIFVAASIFSGCPRPKQPIHYGIAAYQDTALPIVAEKNGWYTQEGLNVDLRLMNWENIMDSVAGGALDVAVMNFNTFQPVANNINDRGGDVIFYYPLYIFKGAAIMVRSNAGMKTFDELLKESNSDQQAAIKAAILQLKGKRVITTEGTEMEQIVLSALERAGLKPGVDVKISHAPPADGLRAFIAGEADAYSGGLTERTEARRRGAIELITSADLLPPVIDGLVTTKRFAASHQKELNSLVKLWFKTIGWMEEDLDNRSKVVIDYLSSKGSTRYTVDEYKYAWQHTQVFPKNNIEMANTMLSPSAPYYWRRSWDANNKFLLDSGKISKPVPYDVFLGESVQKQLEQIAMSSTATSR